MTSYKVGIILALHALVSAISASAPGDEESFCRSISPPPVYPPNSRTLMDSYDYLNLLPPHAGAVWQRVDNDDNNLSGRN